MNYAGKKHFLVNKPNFHHFNINKPQKTPIKPLTSLQNKKPKIQINSNFDLNLTINSKNNIIAQKKLNKNREKEQNFDEIFDFFLKEAIDNDLINSLEYFFNDLFNANSIAVWLYVSSLDILYSRYFHKTTSSSQGLVGFCFFTKQIMKVMNPEKHPSYEENVDFQDSTLLFPLYDNKNNIFCVVQIVKEFNETMNSNQIQFCSSLNDDIKFLEWFSEKIKLVYTHYSKSKSIDQIMLQLNQIQFKDSFLKEFDETISDFFGCESMEIYHNINNAIYKILYYEGATSIEKGALLNDPGIVNFCFQQKKSLNILNVNLHPNYNEEIDGGPINSNRGALFLYYYDPQLSHEWVIVLRCPVKSILFSDEDMELMSSLTPFIITIVKNRI